jgi:thymidylate kinase
MTRHAAQIVTFSGIDGAGKTTQIDCISTHLVRQGYRVARVSFWDDVAFMAKVRAGVSLAVLRKQRVLPRQAVLRHDKNVRTWYLTLARAVFYVLDTLRLRTVVSQLRAGNHDFVIFDRYLYDQLAQIHSRSWLARAYIRSLVRLAPRPHFAFVLDASPDEAFSRKPEYPLDFLYGYRQAFLELSAFVPQLVVIGPSTVEHVGHLILQSLSEGSDVLVNASAVGWVLGAPANAMESNRKLEEPAHKVQKLFHADTTDGRKTPSKPHLWKGEQ